MIINVFGIRLNPDYIISLVNVPEGIVIKQNTKGLYVSTFDEIWLIENKTMDEVHMEINRQIKNFYRTCNAAKTKKY